MAETFSTSPLKPLNRIQRNLTGSKISTSSTKFVFFGPIGKTRWPLCPLIGWNIFDFSSERNSTKLDRKQYLNVLYQDLKYVFFGPIGKTRWPPLASDWLRHFRLLLSNHWTEFNETWQEARSQRPLLSLCFWADRKNKMAALASDWLRHFRLLLWNRWTEFNETWLEARSQRPLPSLCFSGRSEKQDSRSVLWLAEIFSTSPLNGMQRKLIGRCQRRLPRLEVCVFSCRSEKQDGRHGLWLAETFSTSPLKPLNGIQRNLIGSKISMSSANFVFFGPTSKQKWWQIVLMCTICGPLGILFYMCSRNGNRWYVSFVRLAKFNRADSQ